MTKTSKKILIAILLFIATILLSNAKAFAATNAQEAFNEFKALTFDAKRYMYVGEYSSLDLYNIGKYITPQFTFSDNKRVKVEKNGNTYYLDGLKEGSTDLTITLKYNGQTATKKFWIGVVKDWETKTLKQFAYEKYPAEYTIAIGEKIGLKNASSIFQLDTKITVSNSNLAVKKVLNYNDKYIQYIQGKAVGTTTATITAKYDGLTAKKTFKVNTKKMNDAALQSSTDDVKNIVYLSDKKTQVLLANGELWNTDPSTFKLTTKAMGNVSKYVYTDIYFSIEDNGVAQAKNAPSLVLITLKKDKTLTVASRQKTLTAKNAVQASNYGYIDTNKNYYGITKVNGDLQLKKYLTGVTKLFGDKLVLKDGVLYAVSGVKIRNENVKDAIGDTGRGLYLNANNVLYKYEYDYKNKVYKYTKVEENVKYIIDYNTYRTQAGAAKNVVPVPAYEEDSWSTNRQRLSLTANKNIYLNGVKVLSNVDKYYEVGNDLYLIVKKDGSIWKLQLGGSFRFDRVRTGLDSAKRISKTSGLTAKKLSNTQAQIGYRKVEGASKYTIYRSTTKDGKYTKVGTSTTTSFIDKTVKHGQKYYYKVVVNGPSALYDSVMSLPIAIQI